MKTIVNYSSWIVYEDSPYGSGASEKITLKNPQNGKLGIFKYPKLDKNKNSGYTGEFWAEALAEDLAKALNIECAHVDLGVYNGRIGSMSHLIVDDFYQELTEGISFITRKYPKYSQDKFKDMASEMPYSIEMILISLNDYGLGNDFLKIPVFDCFIGNSDRHHSNWAVLKSIKNDMKIAPLYDNGSSLCCYVNEKDVKNYLSDRMRYNSLVFGKSKSMIRINEMRCPRHMEVLEHLKSNYLEQIRPIIEQIRIFTPIEIKEIIYEYDDSVIHSSIKELLYKVLMDRRAKMLELFD